MYSKIFKVLLVLGLFQNLAIAQKLEWEVENRFRLFSSEAEEQNFAFDLERLVVRASGKTRDKTVRFPQRKGEDKEFPDLVDARIFNFSKLPYGINWDPINFEYKRDDVLLTRLNKHSIRARISGLANTQRYKCDWKIDGRLAAKESRCDDFKFEVEFSKSVTLTVDLLAGVGGVRRPPLEATVAPKNIIIASLGDSIASGEGNPLTNTRIIPPQDCEGLKAMYQNPNIKCNDSPLWLDLRCHRSLISGHGLGAWRYSRIHPDQSVTFLSFSCSGARTVDGLTDKYEGIESNLAVRNWAGPLSISGAYSTESLMPSQLDQLKKNLPCRSMTESSNDCVKRIPDVMLISTGANDVKFSEIVKDAVLDGKSDFETNSFKTRLDTLEENYRRLIDTLSIRHLNESKIFLTEYHNPLRFRNPSDSKNLDYCDRQSEDAGRNMKPVGIGGLAKGLSKEGAKALESQVVFPLNRTLANSKVGTVISGWERYTRVEGKGYCKANNSWVFSLAEAHRKTGPDPGNWDQVSTGAAHPNIFGHYYYSILICQELRRHLRRSGDSGKGLASDLQACVDKVFSAD